MAEGNGEPKMVPEKDLLAVKASAERKLEKVKAELQARVDAAEQELDSEKKSRLTADSSVSKIEKELTKAKASLEELDKVTAERDQATKSRDELNKSVIDLTRKRILEGFKLKEDVTKKVEGMETLEELQSYAGVLTDVGKKRDPTQKQKFDAGAGGTAVTEGMTGMELLKKGLAEKSK